jgi:hypothetical protein
VVNTNVNKFVGKWEIDVFIVVRSIVEVIVYNIKLINTVNNPLI